MADTNRTLSFRAWLGRFLTPRRSFAYRELEARLTKERAEWEERYAEQRQELLQTRQLVSKMYNYVLVHSAHLPPVERPEKTKPAEESDDSVITRAIPARPRLSQIHEKYRNQAKRIREEQGLRPVSAQRERVAEVVSGKAAADSEQIELERSLDDAARFIQERTADKAS